MLSVVFTDSKKWFGTWGIPFIQNKHVREWILKKNVRQNNITYQIGILNLNYYNSIYTDIKDP